MSHAQLSPADRQRSHTARMMSAVDTVLGAIPSGSVRTLLDIGCGYGALTMHTQSKVGAQEAHGIDLDPDAVAGAERHGVRARLWDLRDTPLPYDSGMFDLVTSYGSLHYLSTLDGILRDANRLLAPGGLLLVSLPNLASWHNRIILARGFQPRDVEVSSEVLVGVHPRYRQQPPVGHVNGITTMAFCELVEHFGFSILRLVGGSPAVDASGAMALLDDLAARRPTLARRFVCLARKTALPAELSATGWWQEMAARVSRPGEQGAVEPG